GAAAGGVLSYRLLRRVGVPTSEAGFSVGTQSLESAAVLVGLLFFALIVSIPVSGLSPAYLTVTIVGLLLLLAIGSLVVGITRGEERAVNVARRVSDKIPVLDGDRIEAALRTLAAQLTQLATDRRELVRHGFWQASYWLFDAAALWVFIAAYGHWTRLDGLVISFALATIVATIPITPGGLGVMEVALAASLVGFGVPSGVALLGVVSWRLVNFWLPIPAGAAAYLSLRLGRPNQPASEDLEVLTEDARVGAEEASPWRSARREHAHPVETRPDPEPEPEPEPEPDEDAGDD
ncbi:MAG: flippase-like domain-containing protein, partial [Acidimicrobiia bacterium]|nr:flippase-like domain-containing protein [Acidimicrobiia bacterium]